MDKWNLLLQKLEQMSCCEADAYCWLAYNRIKEVMKKIETDDAVKSLIKAGY